MQYQTEAVLANLAYADPLLRGHAFLYNDPSTFAVLQPHQEIVVSFRGTHTWNDVLTDTLLTLGGDEALKQSYTYQKARQVVNTLQSHFPHHSIKLVGHSLGGAIAHQLGKELDLPSVAFNPGSSPLSGQKTVAGDLLKYLQKEPQKDPKHVILRNVWDPVSYFEKDPSQTISHPEDPHSIRPFIS